MYMAEMVREHRERLEEALNEISAQNRPITALEVRLIVDATAARLAGIENALRADAHARTHRRINTDYLRRVLARLRSWAKPRIGILRHYEPKPLMVPASYQRTAPPDPAPTISIVTPSFEQGRFLARTLHSVVSQNYPALEYVVQDGGSSDETLDVLRSFDGLLTAWASEPDNGQADAINRGFQRTTGEIMGWLNSDDLLLPGSLAYVARYFADHPEVDVVYGNRVMIDATDGQIGAWILPAHNDRALTLADYIPQETLFWRRSIWDAAGGSLDTDFGYALDWDLLLRFLDAGATTVCLPRFLGAFRIHDEQKTSAADALGAAECARLRQRVHGRPMSTEEVLRELRPYFLRHVLVHTRQRIIDRLPLRRAHVRTVPFEHQRLPASTGSPDGGDLRAARQGREGPDDAVPTILAQPDALDLGAPTHGI
jgi:glycosyltransferase involved in cell wall biosynthesis